MSEILIKEGFTKIDEIKELREKLNVSTAEAIGVIVFLWCWASDKADDKGLIEGYSLKDIATAINIKSDEPFYGGEEYVKALVDCGFLENAEDGVYVTEWKEAPVNCRRCVLEE